MENISELYGRAREHGMELWVEDGRLKCRCPTDLERTDLLRELQDQREQVIAFLEGTSASSNGGGARPDFTLRPARSDVVPIPGYLSHFWAAVQDGRHGIGYTNGTNLAAWTEKTIHPELFRHSLHILMSRYDILAARVTSTADADGFVCDVDPDLALQVIDAADSDPETVEAELKPRLKRFYWEPFEVDKSLFRVLLVRLPAGASGVAFVIHHFVADDVSVLAIADALSAIYASMCLGEEPSLPVVRMQYPQYLAGMDKWCRSGGVNSHVDYWLKVLDSAPPTSLRKPAPYDDETEAHMHSEHFFIRTAAADAIEARSAECGGTMFMGLIAIIALSIRHTTGQQDLTIKMASDGRHFDVPPDAVGRFTNLVPVRLRLGACQSFEQVFEEVRTFYFDSFPHWICPYEVLHPQIVEVGEAADAPLVSFRDFGTLKADTAHSAVFGEVRTYDLGMHPGGPPPQRTTSGKKATNWELVFHRTPDGIVGRFTYHPLIHDETKTAAFYQHFMSRVDGFQR